MQEKQISDAKVRAMAKHCIENNPSHLHKGEFDLVKESLLEAIKLHSNIKDQTDDDYYEMAALHYNLAALSESHFHDNLVARQFYQLAIEHLNKIKEPAQEDVDLMKVYPWHLSKIIKQELPLSKVGPDSHFSSSNLEKNSRVASSFKNEQEQIGDKSSKKVVQRF